MPKLATPTALDPHPTNELGKGVIDPAAEARVLARGGVFARRLTTKFGDTFLVWTSRPLATVATDMALAACAFQRRYAKQPAAG